MKKWSQEHKRLLFSDLTNSEISEIVGRPVSAVRKQRYYLTGHAVELERAYDINKNKMSEVASECRILDMAKRLNIKIEGVR